MESLSIMLTTTLKTTSLLNYDSSFLSSGFL